MPLTLNLPDIRTVLSKLDRRISILERRVNPVVTQTAPSTSRAHDGTGTGSIVLEPTGSVTDSSGPHSVTAGYNSFGAGINAVTIGRETSGAGENSVAIGTFAIASRTDDIAIGREATTPGATSGDDAKIAIGAEANAQGASAIALGENTFAFHDNAVALGDGASTSGANQVTIGQKRLLAGAPSSPLSGAALATNMFTLSVDESSNELRFRVKYSDGTVKNGAVTLT